MVLVSFDGKKRAHSSYFTKLVVEGDSDRGTGGYRDTWQGPELETPRIEGTSKYKCLSVFAFFLCIVSMLLFQPASSAFTLYLFCPFIVLASIWFMASSHNLTLLPAGLVP